jgi:hypothetical protein
LEGGVRVASGEIDGILLCLRARWRGLSWW